MIQKLCFHGELLLFLSLVFLVTVASCSKKHRVNPSVENNAGPSGDLAVELVWPETGAETRLSAPPGVATVEITISGPSMTTMSNSFPATGGKGLILGVPAGANRAIVARGLDSNSKCIYFGSKGGVNIQPASANKISIQMSTSTLTQASMVSAGGYHTCALMTSGGVRCWGYNVSGQVGNGTTTHSLTPVDVSGLSTGAIVISAGEHHSCVLTSSGGVKCWGANIAGELGNGIKTSSSVPVDVSGLQSGINKISTGGYNTCALNSSGGIKCWGENSSGQLGIGTQTGPETCSLFSCSTVPIDVPGLTSGIDSITTGDSFTCASTFTEGVKCWGNNLYGNLGNGTATILTSPTDVSGLTGVVSVAAGGAHTCAITSTGGVKCWGSNSMGSLGNGTTTNSVTPVDVVNLDTGVVAITLGGSHTCVLTAGGGVKCWGYNEQGQLGNGSAGPQSCYGYSCSLTPIDVSGLTSGFKSISAGFQHTCAVMLSGQAKCWGNNSFGQLGNGTTISTFMPVSVIGFSE